MSSAVSSQLSTSLNNIIGNKKTSSFENNNEKFDFNNLVKNNNPKSTSYPAKENHNQKNIDNNSQNDNKTSVFSEKKYEKEEIIETDTDISFSQISALPLVADPLNSLEIYEDESELDRLKLIDTEDELLTKTVDVNLSLVIPVEIKFNTNEAEFNANTNDTIDLLKLNNTVNNQSSVLGSDDKNIGLSTDKTNLEVPSTVSNDFLLTPVMQSAQPTALAKEIDNVINSKVENLLDVQKILPNKQSIDNTLILPQANIVLADKSENILSAQNASNIKLDNDSKSFISANLLLADESAHGRLVFEKMTNVTDSKLEISPINAINSKNITTDLTQDPEDEHNNFSDKKNIFEFTQLSKTSPDTELFQISFKTNTQESNTLGSAAKNILLKPEMQIYLSIKETLSASNTLGNKEMIINLFPQNLGAIKVEIISVMGEGNIRKIESIKIITEKRETLDILEKNRIDLEKTLKEVTNTKEEASLEFEMNHQGQGSKGAYFQSQEERENWMSNFAPMQDDENSANALNTQEIIDSGYITEDSVNIKV